MGHRDFQAGNSHNEFFSPKKISLAIVWMTNHKGERSHGWPARDGGRLDSAGSCEEEGQAKSVSPDALPFSRNIFFIGDFHIVNFMLSIITRLQVPWGQNHTGLIYLSDSSLEHLRCLTDICLREESRNKQADMGERKWCT